MNFGYLKWQEDELTLICNSYQRKLNLEKVAFDEIGYIKLAVDQYWQLALLRENQTKCEFWFSEDGRDWSLYPENPEKNAINLDEDWYFLYPQINSVAIIKKPKKLFAICNEGQWQSIAIPEGTKWIDIGAGRCLWAVGFKPAVQVKHCQEEVACWKREPDSLVWEASPVVMISRRNTNEMIDLGGFSQFREANVRMEPFVFASECTWFLDDPSWYLYIKLPDGKFYGHKLQDLVVDSIWRDSNGAPVILASNYEKNVMLTWSGKQWVSRDLTKTIIKHLVKADDVLKSPPRLSFAYSDGYLLAVGKVSENPTDTENIVLLSKNSGQDWEIIHREGEKDSILFCPFIKN